MDDRHEDTSRAAVLALQPLPLKTQACRHDGVLAISRIMTADDALRCGLCPACHATPIRGTGLVSCLVQTTEPVADADAPLFRDPATSCRAGDGAGAGRRAGSGSGRGPRGRDVVPGGDRPAAAP